MDDNYVSVTVHSFEALSNVSFMADFTSMLKIYEEPKFYKSIVSVITSLNVPQNS